MTGHNLEDNEIGDAGTESFAGVLAQCTVITELNLGDNQIGNAGAGSFAGVLTQCAALVHLDLSENHICTVWESKLRAS